MRKGILVSVFFLMALYLVAQEHQQGEPQSMANDFSATEEHMGHEHHHDGAHMHMSALRDPQPGDEAKAQQIVEQARQALEKYKDYHVALAEGFVIFLPNVKQPMYHFTNWDFAVGEAFRFDPSKPTSLLYEKKGDDYKLIGAMYTAPVRFTEEQLNQRVPLSVAQWHQHVNMCRPPKGQERDQILKGAKFGLNGSISSKEACEAAGGTFMPHLFGWMVHMYPWEKTQDAIWSVERQLKDNQAAAGHHDHEAMTH